MAAREAMTQGSLEHRSNSYNDAELSLTLSDKVRKISVGRFPTRTMLPVLDNEKPDEETCLYSENIKRVQAIADAVGKVI